MFLVNRSHMGRHVSNVSDPIELYQYFTDGLHIINIFESLIRSVVLQIAEVAQESLRKLNPMVQINASLTPLREVEMEYYKSFDVVCMSSTSVDQLVKVDDACHKHGVKFFSGAVFGYYGYMFSDLGTHEYAE